MARASELVHHRLERSFAWRLRRAQGFATTEAAIAVSVLIVIIVSGLAMAYFAISIVWVENASYEASICAASRAELHRCRSELRLSIERALPIGKIEALSVERYVNQVRTHLRFRIHPDLEPIDHRDERRLPLLEPKAGTNFRGRSR